MSRSKLAVAVTLAGTLLASAAQALGLGAIEAKSGLNQPLDARISLISAGPAELDSLAVALASGTAFQRAGVERPFHLSQLIFEVVRGDRPYVRVTTRGPVKEPFLDFLVEANWPRGRLVREYTLLLDPPVYAADGAAPAVAAATASGPADQGRARATAAVAAPAPTSIASQTGAAAHQYGPVKSNDTLWQIASDARPDASVSVNQMMVAVFQANPEAFIDEDMNRLKRGAVLRLPEAAAVAQIDAATANGVVRAQFARWRQEQAAAKAKPAPVSGRLQVVAPSDAGGERAALTGRESPSTSVSQLQRELTLSEEAAASLRAENEELRAQVEALKRQATAGESLVSIETGQTTPGMVQAAEEPASTEPAAEAAAEPVADAESAAEAKPVAEVEPVVAEAAPAAPVPVAPPVAAEPPEAPGFFTDTRNLGVLGGVGLLLAALVYLLFRRRRHDDDVVAAPAVALEPRLDDEAPVAEAEAAPALQAPEPRQDMPPESDALGEAEVYLAYGRYDQAEEVVAKALEQTPERTDLRLKLLEILALTQNAEGFESHARTLQEQVDATDPAWLRAAEMGREFLPDSNLFSATAVAPAGDSDFGDFDFDAAEEAAVELPLETVAADGLEAGPAAADSGSDDSALDFLLDEPDLLAAVETAEAAPAQDYGLDFKLDDSPADDAQSGNVVEFTLPEDEAHPEEALGAEAEDEVGTKLDLARAYLDMGDGDGARGLLDEVLGEGNASQKREAEDLLRQIA